MVHEIPRTISRFELLIAINYFRNFGNKLPHKRNHKIHVVGIGTEGKTVFIVLSLKKLANHGNSLCHAYLISFLPLHAGC